MPARFQRKPTLRKRVRVLMERPAVELSVLVLILVSVGLLVVEIALAEDAAVAAVLDIVNHVITGIFAVEMLIRYWVAKKKSRFFRMYWLDLLALLPVVRPLRMLRVLRLLRLWRAGRLITRRALPFQGMFAVAITELITLATVTAALVLSAALLLKLAEGGPFESVESSLWFAVMSLVAGEPVGQTPVTTVGRWATLALMVGGLTVFGLFVGTVSASMGARLAKRMEGQEMDLDELEDHVVVCGWNGASPTLLRELFAAGTPAGRSVVVVTEGAERPADWPTSGVRAEHLYHHQGDWTRLEVLEAIGIRTASTCLLMRDQLVARSDQDRDARTVLAALTIEQINPDIYTVAELHTRQSERMLRVAGVEEVVVGERYSGMILGSASRNPGLVQLLDDILDMRSGNSIWSCAAPAEVEGLGASEVRRRLHDRFEATLMSVARPGERVVVNPADDYVVHAGDTLMVVARNAPKW
jgi:voltage-gated potassium channel